MRIFMQVILVEKRHNIFKCHIPVLLPVICDSAYVFGLSGHSQKKGFSLDLCKSLVALMDVSSNMKEQSEKRLSRFCVACF